MAEKKDDKVETRVAEKLTVDPQFSSGKFLVNGIAGVLMYMWCDLLGRPVYPVAAYVALLMSPLRLGWSFSERCEVRSVISIYFFILSAGVLPIWCLRRGGAVGRSLLAIYVSWYMLFDRAHLRGGRFMPTFRRRNFWKHFAAYFPMSLTRTAKLDPKRNYIFGYHPHGVISMGACCNFATEATGFSELFPGIDLRLLTLEQNFRVPVFREYLLGLGVNSVSKASINGNLTRGPGASVMIVIGGARESLETAPGSYNLILDNRKDCIDDRNITQKRDAAVAKAEEIKADVQRSVQKFLKDHGRDGLALLPANPAVPKNTVYSNGALCFGVITLVASFTMRLGVVLADAAFTCPYEQDTELGRRDCALDVLGLVSVIIRFSGLASNACVAIVGDSNPTGQCVVATSSIPTAAFSLSAAAANVEAACKKAFETWDPNAWPFEKQVTFPLVDNGDVVLPVI